MAQKKAFITGVTGQDGGYLASFLMEKGYDVHGMIRWASTRNADELDWLEGVTLHYGDLTDSSALCRLLMEIRPDEIYNLAALSHVHISFDLPEYAGNVDGLGCARLLEAIRISGLGEDLRFYNASTSELYGDTSQYPQNENTPFQPCSPYAAAKLYAYWMTVTYRQAYGVHASNGILFNHESPWRGDHFVTRKITRAVAAISQGKQKTLKLGNLDAKRDWGYAPDYVEGMWLMLQQDNPDDYVLATGVTRTVRDFVEAAFSCINIDIEWRGHGLEEQGCNQETGDVLVEIDQDFFRPTDPLILLGDASKAQEKLKWKPHTDFNDMVRMMVQNDVRLCGT